MGLSVKVALPHFPDGMEVEIPGLGAFENNGKASNITEEQEEAFLLRTGLTVRESVKDSEGITVSGDAAIGPKKADKIMEEVVEAEGGES